MSKLLVICILYLVSCIFPITVNAISDPLSVPNNKFGIHIISAVPDEASDAALLVNSTGGDWGYITFLIESTNRDKNRWQSFFDYLREKHLIPIVRLATQPQGNFWKRPYDGEEVAWADFLNSLNWPTKNRYIVFYNEPNHATEWGNSVDAKDYAKILDKTISALKEKSEDFFVLNAGLDASAPQKLPAFQDEFGFMKEMETTVPGIFNRLDGWVSHSYPNPDFTGSPQATGRGTIRTFEWEEDALRKLGVNKPLPIFITETGWKHSEGIDYNQFLPSPKTVADYYKTAFSGAWTKNNIVAVTPFILNYQESPFDHFSFKKIKDNDYHPPFQTFQSLPKTRGHPTQEYLAKIESGSVYNTLVLGESYNIALTVKNVGQSIWNEYGQVRFVPSEGDQLIDSASLIIPVDIKIEPEKTYTFNLKVTAAQLGIFKVKMNLWHGPTQFESEPIEFTTEVKSPVTLKVKANLKWKNDYSGEYILNFAGIVKDTIKNIILSQTGLSDDIKVRSLLPDNAYDFTLQKPFYIPKTIHQTVKTGPNTLDFGTLQPDIPSAILHPSALWHLLPFSN